MANYITKEIIDKNNLEISDTLYLYLLIDIRDALTSLDRHLCLALNRLKKGGAK